MTDGTGKGAWLAATKEWLAGQSLPVRESDDGRLLTAVPLNEDRSSLLRISLGATDQTNGMVARANTGVEVGRDDWPKALWLCNRWNRAQASPRATLLVQDWDNDDSGSFILDDWLPAGGEPSAEQIDRFAQAFVRGATTFARDPLVRQLSASM